MMWSQEFTDKLWYGVHPLSYLLLPLSWLYKFFMMLRRLGYNSGLLPVKRVGVPVIVVGNITTGGAGKTPLVIWLAQYLKQNNFHPGIVSRGYGGAAKLWPQQVRPDSNPGMVGDEPVVIARRTLCPMAVSPDRYQAAEQLLEHEKCDILICDDGLQHHALARDIEILVIDSVRRFGNRRCLPAGPLRESLGRLRTVDMIVCNGNTAYGEYQMEYIPGPLQSLVNSHEQMEIEMIRGKAVHAIAGIGHPARFFSLLRAQRVNVIEHQYPDHHQFRRQEIYFDDDLPVVMTEKDAVKCEEFADARHWYVPIDVKMGNIFEHRLSMLLKDITNGQKTA